MTLAKVIVLVLTIVMAVTLVYGFTQGDLSADGAVIMSIPWGIVSLVDVYVGFTLFSGWVVFREPSRLRALLWVILIMVLGSFIAGLYTFLALQTSAGDWRRFWLGHRAEDAKREQ
jgi:hypothetical protein